MVLALVISVGFDLDIKLASRSSLWRKLVKQAGYPKKERVRFESFLAMALKPDHPPTATHDRFEYMPSEFPAPAISERSPLVRFQRTETFLRQQTLDRLTPVLSFKTADKLNQWSQRADDSWQELTQIDVAGITDQELKAARLFLGLTLAGFGALFLLWLLLYLYVLHPELNPAAQIRAYWYPYIGFVSLGVTGLILLGREAMRGR